MNRSDLYETPFLRFEIPVWGFRRINKNRLFRSFSQVDASTSRRFGGKPAWALSSAKRLSELMGGQMWVESTGVSGRRLDLPFHHSGGKKHPIRNLPTSEKRKTRRSLAGRKVLIVDDDKNGRDILVAQTKTLGDASDHRGLGTGSPRPHSPRKPLRSGAAGHADAGNGRADAGGRAQETWPTPKRRRWSWYRRFPHRMSDSEGRAVLRRD